MGNESNSGIDRSALEKSWANQAARLTLGDVDRRLWSTSQYTVRPYVYFNKILIAWQLLHGEPVIKDILTVCDIDVSFQEGIWLRLKSKVTQKETLIRHSPRKLEGLEIFAWVPFFDEMRFVSADWNDPEAPRALRLAACFKMQERPDNNLVEGADYLSELHNFRERFSAYKDTRF